MFRLGRFHRVTGPGLYWIIPLIDWQRMIDMRITTVTVEQQETITKDSVTIKVNAVLWYRVVDADEGGHRGARTITRRSTRWRSPACATSSASTCWTRC